MRVPHQRESVKKVSCGPEGMSFHRRRISEPWYTSERTRLSSRSSSSPCAALRASSIHALIPSRPVLGQNLTDLADVLSCSSSRCFMERTRWKLIMPSQPLVVQAKVILDPVPRATGLAAHFVQYGTLRKALARKTK